MPAKTAAKTAGTQAGDQWKTGGKTRGHVGVEKNLIKTKRSIEE